MTFVNARTRVAGRDITLADHGPRQDDGHLPLLLLHGGIIDQADYSWSRVAAQLADRRRVIVPDLPGYGASAGFDGAHDLEDFGTWLIGFLDAMGLARVDLAGLSMGGGIALWCALNHPERIGRLVLVDAYGLSARAGMHPVVARLVQGRSAGLFYRAAAQSRLFARLALHLSYARLRLARSETDDLMRAAQVQNRRRSFDGFARREISRSGLRTDYSERVGQIALPTLLIHGRRDPLIPLADARQAADRMPDARLAILPGGHVPMRQNHDAFVAALTDFLDRPGRGDAPWRDRTGQGA
ncbi:alpha/beta fold hydrolase [Oceaniglobus trochenteri]|uniref:alpha/beta fold hydrolase n=1 Tax=Oceaniglobus trochenteri TaxID=2763260 RepID=UPI001CFF9CEF|nr:alpha/beta fold hydrolase [Oceaniglobus trochenteri]